MVKILYFYKDLETTVGMFLNKNVLMGMKYNAFGWGFIYFYCANYLEMEQVIHVTRIRFGVS